MSLGLRGELVFINQQTKEKIKVPALAVYKKRQVSSATSQRFAICAYFAHIEEVGYWDEVQKRISNEKALEAAKWLAVSFRLSDEKVAKTFEQEVVSLLSTNGEPTEFAQKRIRRVRLDEWARGWMFDLCYEPFQGLQNSAKKILQLNESCAIVLEEEQVLHKWLDECVKIYGHGEAQSSLAIPNEIYHRAHEDNNELSVKDGGLSKNDTSIALSFEESSIDILNFEAIQEPLVKMNNMPQLKIKEDFGGVNIETKIDTKTQENEVGKQAPVIGNGYELKVPNDVDVTRPAVGKTKNENSKASEGEVFLDPKMTSFEALAIFSAEQIRRGVVRANHSPSDFAKEGTSGKTLTNNTTETLNEKPAVPDAVLNKESKNVINFDVVRLPLATTDRINWNETLYMPTKFISKEHFDLLKQHWKASIDSGAGSKLQSLYSIDALMALSANGVEYTVNGYNAQERHINNQTRQIDPERLTLYALSNNTNWDLGFVVAQHAASLVFERTLQSIALQQKNISENVKESQITWETIKSAKIGSMGSSALKIGKWLEKKVMLVPNFQADGFSIFELDSISEIKCLKLSAQLKEIYEKVKEYPYLNISKSLESNFMESLTNSKYAGKIVLRERFYGKNKSLKPNDIKNKCNESNLKEAIVAKSPMAFK